MTSPANNNPNSVSKISYTDLIHQEVGKRPNEELSVSEWVQGGISAYFDYTVSGLALSSIVKVLSGCDKADKAKDTEVGDSAPPSDLDGDGYSDADDCDDTNPSVNPSMPEVCNGIDDNCDGTIDERIQNTYYADADGDGYGDASTTIAACDVPTGYAADSSDCDDTSASVNPAATEQLCNGIDEDCDTWDGTSTHGEYLAAGVVYMTCLNSGTFTMGSPEDEIGRDSSTYDETAHTVQLTHDFLIGTYLVTQDQFEALEGRNPSANIGGDNPVESLNWSQAADFANRVSAAEGLGECYTCIDTDNWPSINCELDPSLLGNPYACDGYRLPTEAEYEHAARSEGAIFDAFPNGGNLVSEADIENCSGSLVLDNGTLLDSAVWYCGNTSNSQPVGLLLPNASGLYDMVGNVVIFINDWWDPNYYSISPTIDPTGPSDGSSYVIRAGYASWPWSIRIAYRHPVGPFDSSIGIGMRLARTY